LIMIPVGKASLARLIGLPLNIVAADKQLSALAGELKVMKKMSFANVLPQRWRRGDKSEIYTEDPEFKKMEQEVKSFGCRSLLQL
jgi:hypothetical protein